MIVNELKANNSGMKVFAMDPWAGDKNALFNKSLLLLLESVNSHYAMMSLVRLMTESFPLSAPTLMVLPANEEGRVYSVFEEDEPGVGEVVSNMGEIEYSHIYVSPGPYAVNLGKRIYLGVLNTPRTQVVLRINDGVHRGIFKDWVKMLTPAIEKLIDNEYLRGVAFRDSLTGLLSRRAFDDMITSEWERASRYGEKFSLIFIDIDKFKEVNDSLGHQAGDTVLKSVASKLDLCARKSDFVFRYGGDEFVIIMPNTRINMAVCLAERIGAAVEEMGLLSGLGVTVSLGVSEYKDGLEVEDLVMIADKGLYAAKGKGRNRVEVYEDIK